MKILLRSGFLFFSLLFITAAANAQLIGSEGFLKGNYLEVGISSCGSYGTLGNAPSGYHPKDYSSSSWQRMGFVADVGKDGWGTGSPNFCGDYFLPSNPEEGWGIEINGANYGNFKVCQTDQIPGSLTSVDNSGATVTAQWQGSIQGLSIEKNIEFDTNTVFFSTSVTITNTNSFTVENIYYMRNVDPDNERPLTGSHVTTNEIVYQNPNAQNLAVVQATGLTYGCLLALGSKDPRAKVAHGGFSNRDASSIYEGTGVHSHTGSNTADRAISIAFDLGDLSPGESTCLTYFYMFDTTEYATALSSSSFECINLFTLGVNPYICPEDSFFVNYFLDTANVLPLATNIFTVQLSDSAGSFANPTTIGSKASTAPEDSIKVSIPGTVPFGDQYRIRVVTSAPVEIGADNGYDLTIGSPQPNFGPTSTVCSGNPLTLSVDAGGQFYVWSTGATTNSITVTSSGLYQVTVLNGNCLDTFSTNVTAKVSPIFFLTDSVSQCNADSVEISAGIGYPQYLWSTGATTYNTFADSSGAYFCTVTGNNGCSASDSTVVTLVDARITADKDSVCAFEEVRLSTPLYSDCFYFFGFSTDQLVTEDISFFVNDDYGSIAVTPDYIYYTGDLATVRMDADDFGNKVQYLKRDGIFSDLSSGQLYTFWNPNFNGFSQSNVSAIRKMNENLTYGETVLLNGSLNFSFSGNGVFAGEGYILVFNRNDNKVYHIDTETGDLTDLGLHSQLANTLGYTEGWAAYGVAECSDDGFSIIYRHSTNNSISRYSIDDLSIQTVTSYSSSLGDMNSFTYSPWNEQWYFQFEGSAPALGSGNEVIGKASALLGSESFTYEWSTGDSSNAITVQPTSTTTYYVTVSGAGVSCIDSQTVHIKGVPFAITNDTLFYCNEGNPVIDPGSGYQSYSWSTGETTQTIVPTANTVTLEIAVTDSFGCDFSKTIEYYNIQNPIDLSSDPLCASDEIGIYPKLFSRCNEIVDISSNDSAVVNIYSNIFNDRAGMALTQNYVYYVGLSNTLRMDKDLTNPVLLPLRRGILSNILDGQLFSLGDSIAAFNGSKINMLHVMDSALNFVDTIVLSQTIDLSSGSGIFTGAGYFILWNNLDDSFYKISFYTGEVEFLNTWNMGLPFTDDFAIYGMAGCNAMGEDILTYNLHYWNYNYMRQANVQNVQLTNFTVANGALGAMESIAFSPWEGRWYFHYEGSSSEFGSGQQMLGYASLNYRPIDIPYNWSNGEDKAIVKAKAQEVNGLVLSIGSGTSVCSDTVDVPLYSSIDLGLADSIFNCLSSTLTITANTDPSIISYNWSEGSVGSSIVVSQPQTLVVSALDTFGCTHVDQTYAFLMQAGIEASSPNNCDSNGVTLSVGSFAECSTIDDMTFDNYLSIEGYSTINDDHGGIAVTQDYVYYISNSYTVRMTTDFDSLTQFPYRNFIFADQGTGELYGLGTGTSTLTQLYKYDKDLNTDSTISLSSTIFGSYSQVGVYPGDGYVIIGMRISGTNWRYYHVELADGTVTLLNSSLNTSIWFAEGYQNTGVATCDENGYAIYHRSGSPNNEIQKLSITTGQSETIATFPNLGDMDGFAISPWLNRWFCHHEGSFGGLIFRTEGMFQADMSYTPGKDIQWSTGETSSSIFVNPDSLSSYSVQVSLGSNTCTDTISIDVASATTFSLPSDTLTDCGNLVTIDAGPQFVGYNWSTGDTTQVISVTESGLIIATVIDSNLCALSDTVYANPRSFGIETDFSAVCLGDSIELRAVGDIPQCLEIGGYSTSPYTTQSINLSFDDRCGLAVTENYFYSTGDFSTVRFDKSNLSIQTSLPLHDGVFSDISSGELYSFWNSTSNSWWSNQLNALKKMDENFGTVEIIPLNRTLNLYSYGNGVFVGNGYVILSTSYNDSIYYIDLQTGGVTGLASYSLDSWMYGSEGWATYGVAECTENGYAVHFRYSSTQIRKYDLVLNQQSVVLSSSSSLGDLSGFTYSRWDDMWYFHFEGFSSTFGSGSESIGRAPMDAAFEYDGDIVWSTGDTAVSIFVTPDSATTYHASYTASGGTCSDSITIYTASPPVVSLDSLYSGCSNTGISINLPGYNFYNWSNGDTDSTGNYFNSAEIWVEVADTGGCFARDSALAFVIPSDILASATTVCDTDSLVLYASVPATGLTLNTLSTSNAMSNEIQPQLFDDYSGIAVTPYYAYVTGDFNSVRVNAHDLQDPQTLPFTPSLFSDLGSGKLYKLWDTLSTTFSYLANAMIELDENLNDLDTIPLSQSIQFQSSSPRNGMFAGSGHLVVFTDWSDDFLSIDIATGQVDLITSINYAGNFYASEGWAVYGFSEKTPAGYKIYYRGSLSRIYSYTFTGSASIFYSFSNISDMANFTYSPWHQRLFMTHEGFSQFANHNEAIVSIEATDNLPYSYLWSTGDTTRSITTLPTASGYINLEVSLGASTCEDSILIFVPSSVTQTDIGDTIIACGTAATITPASGLATFNWSTGAQTPSIEVTSYGVYSLTATDTAGCESSDNVTVVLLDAELNQLEAPSCVGDTVVYEVVSNSSCLFVSNLETTNPQDIGLQSFLSDDNTGIAVTPNHVFMNGDGAIVRLNANTLTYQASYNQNWRYSIFSDLNTGELYAFYSNVYSYFNSNYINLIYKLDSALNPIDTIMLSELIQPGNNSGVYAGFGSVILNSGNSNSFYSIDLTTGMVEQIATESAFYSPYSSEGWANYGVAICGGSGYELIYRASSGGSVITKYNLETGNTSTLSTLSNLGDMGVLAVSPWNKRWYGYAEFGSQFGSVSEQLFSADFTEDIWPLSAITWNDGSTGSSYNASADSTTEIISATLNTTCASCVPCTLSDTLMIDSAIVVSASAVNNIDCEGDDDGVAFALASGGSLPYSYAWTNGDSTATATGMNGGWHVVTVSSALGCSESDSVFISEPQPITVLRQAIPPTCPGDTNGYITITVSGPEPPYTFVWSTGSTVNGDSNLGSGTYTVTITDSIGCESVRSYALTNGSGVIAPTPLTVSQSEVCSGDSVTFNAFSGIGGSGSLTTFSQNSAVQFTQANGDTMVYEFVGLPQVFSANAVMQAFYRGDLDAANETVSYYGEGGFFIGTSDPTAGCGNFYGTKSFNIPTALLNQWRLDDTVRITVITSAEVNLCNPKYQGYVRFQYIQGNKTYWFLEDCWKDKSLAFDSISSFSLAPDSNLTFYAANFNSGCWSSCDSISVSVVEDANLTLNFDTVNLCSKTSINLKADGADAFYWFPNTGLNAVVGDSVIASPSNDRTYTVYAQNANGCTDTGYVRVNVNESLFLSEQVTENVSCYGLNDGLLTARVDGGNEPYQTIWNTGTSTDSITDLVAGNYWYYALDTIGGCEDTFHLVVTEPDTLVPVFNVQNVSCFGLSDASITVSFDGGTAPFDISWSTGHTDTTISGLAAGVYTLTYSDSNGCGGVDSVTITQPDALVASQTVLQDAFCQTVSNGTVTTNISGGTAPHSVLWSNSETGDTTSTFAIGAHWLFVTDTNGCTDTSFFNIAQIFPDPVVSIDSISDVLCFGDSTGTVHLSSTGTSPYNYSWSNGFSGADNTSLPIGSYVITLTDSAGCTDQLSFTINQPSALAIDSLTTSDPNCFGASDGQAMIAVSGGAGSYDYAWNTGLTASFSNALASGTYAITATDSNGCSIDSAFSLADPAAIVINLDSLIDVSCFGGSDGLLGVSASNVVGTPMFSWSNGDTDAIIDSLLADEYVLTITDSVGCSAIDTFSVTEPTLLSVILSVDSLDCFDGTDATVNSSVSGGSTPYSYAWSNGGNTDSIAGLGAGTYTLQVTDSKGCVDSASADVAPGDSLQLAFNLITGLTCLNDTNGVVAVTASGGSAPYSYLWENGMTSDTASMLTAGYHTITATDAAGCATIDSTFVTTIPSDFTVTIDSLVSNDCFGEALGYARIAVSGTSGPFTMMWPDGGTDLEEDSLATGFYVVTVTDAGGCADTIGLDITEPDELQITFSSVTDVLCFGTTTGSADAVISGGTMPYGIDWSTGDTTAAISSVGAGVYYLSVTDANGCSREDSIEVVDLYPPMAVSETVFDIACTGANSGGINLSVSGGSEGYSYTWGTGDTTANRSGLTAGTYVYTVTDSVGCTVANAVTIDPFDSIQVVFTQLAPVVCHDDSSAILAISVTGGAGSYSYAWNNGDTADTLFDLNSGNYVLTVTDAAGCIHVDSSVISNPDLFTVAIDSIRHIYCNGDSSGYLALLASGGEGSIDYFWANGSTANTRDTLAAGAYAVMLTDSLGCTIDTSFTITEPDVFELVLDTALNPKCAGSSDGIIAFMTNGGSGTAEFYWNGTLASAFDSALVEGVYTVVAIDSLGCSDSLTVTLTEPDSLFVITDSVANNTCFDADDGFIAAHAIGGTGPYTFAWNTSSVDSSINNLDTGSYSVVITDANGCIATESYYISQPDTLVAAVDSTDNASCYTTTNNGYIAVTTTGGTFPYTYAWSNGADTSVLDTLSDGNYTLTVTDAHGCTSTLVQTIVRDTFPVVSLSAIDPICIDLDSVALSGATPAGGQFFGNAVVGGQFFTTISGSGIHDVFYTFTDGNGCADTASQSIQVDSLPVVTFDTVPIACIEAGEITLTQGAPAGGIYFGNGITGNAFDPTAVGVGIYEVGYTVTTIGGCTDTALRDIEVREFPEVSFTDTNALCSNDQVFQLTGGLPSGGSYYGNGVSNGLFNPAAVGNGNITVGYTYTDVCGIDSVTHNITVHLAPTPIIGLDASVCLNDSLSLQTSTPFNSYAWSTGDDGASIQLFGDRLIENEGSISVTVEDDNQCFGTNSIELTLLDTPVVNLGLDTSICHDTSIVITGPEGNAFEYLWSNDATTRAITGYDGSRLRPEQLEYTLTVTNADGCTGFDDINISIIDCDTLKAIGYYSIYPIPTRENLTLEVFASESQELEVQIFETLGKLVYLRTFQIAKGKNWIDLDASSLGSGMFVVRFLLDGQLVSERVVVY